MASGQQGLAYFTWHGSSTKRLHGSGASRGCIIPTWIARQTVNGGSSLPSNRVSEQARCLVSLISPAFQTRTVWHGKCLVPVDNSLPTKPSLVPRQRSNIAGFNWSNKLSTTDPLTSMLSKPVHISDPELGLDWIVPHDLNTVPSLRAGIVWTWLACMRESSQWDGWRVFPTGTAST